VSKEEGERLAEKYGFMMMRETSAKEGLGVEGLFGELARAIREKDEEF
jgi:hypothetical protein